jgi:hypothetical protein
MHSPTEDIPDNWFVLYQGSPRYHEAQHFCSRACLYEWLQGRQGDWDKLSSEQADAIEKLEYRMHEIMAKATKEFRVEHPKLHVEWAFRMAFVRIKEV